MDYDAVATTYESLEPWYEHLYGVLHTLVRAELAPVAGQSRGRALDAGCGTGFQAAVLDSLGYHTHGLDVSAGLLAVARRRRPAIVLARGDITCLPYPGETFDAVTCCGSTLSYVHAPARALAEIGRVLRPGGLLLLECEPRWSLDLLWEAFSSLTGDSLGYGLGPRDVWRHLNARGAAGCRVRYPGYGTIRLFSAGEIRMWLDAAGLEPVRMWGIHVLTNVIPSTVLHRERLNSALAALYRILCRLDDGLRRSPLAARAANSLVVLAQKRGTGSGREA